MNKTSLFGAGQRRKSATVTAQQRINMYAELQPVEDGTRIAFYGTPGKDLFLNTGADPGRGAVEVGNYLYSVHGSVLYRISRTAGQTNKGMLGTFEGKVGIAAGDTQILIVDGFGGYVYNFDTDAFSAITDPDFPVGATTATWQDGYFIVEFGTEFYITTDATAWNAVDKAAAEKNPDELIRVYSDGGQLFLFGRLVTEPWIDTGASDFPYALVSGAAMEYGLAAKWSVAKFDTGVIFLAQNRLGDVSIMLLSGYQLTPLSKADEDAEFNSYTTADASAFAYKSAGHSFYQINFPTQGKSWLYDGTSGLWSELRAGTDSRDRAELGATFNGAAIVSDYGNGNLYRLNPDTYTDNGNTVIGRLVSRHIQSHDFVSVYELWIEIEAGVGLATGQGSNPLAMLRVSKDGGKSWGSEITAGMGAVGQYKTRLSWRRLGRARNWTFEVSISDPVKRAILAEGWVT